jgi:transposase
MKRRKFTPEFKEQAVKLVMEQGLSVYQASNDLGIGESTLSKWVGEYRQNKQGGEEISISEKEELKQLRKEVHILRMERDVLKKATAIFSKMQG